MLNARISIAKSFLLKGKNYLPFATAVAFLVLYLFGLSHNNSLDAWGYAADVKNGQDLFLPHHLLYNALGYCWIKLLQIFTEVEVIRALQGMNAIFAFLSLVVLAATLTRLDISVKTVTALIVQVGSSWSVMRFATENEAYIVPIFFSMLGSYFLLTFLQKNRIGLLVTSGLLFAVAALFHQVMFFGWLAVVVSLAVKRNKFWKAVIFAVPALVVPLTYLLAFVAINHNFSISGLVQFTLSDYITGSASISLSAKSLLLFVISVIRTFMQVHGYMWVLLKANWFLWSVTVFVLLLLGKGLLVFIKQKVEFSSNIFLQIAVTALVFHLLFSIFSGGNAEFLVMLPFLVAIIIAFAKQINLQCLWLVAIGLFTWNVAFGLLPLRYKTLDDSPMVINRILQDSSAVADIYILNSVPRIENELDYMKVQARPTFIKSEDLRNPAIRDSIGNLLKSGLKVYTNAYHRPQTVSRETIVGNSMDEALKNYVKIPVDSVNTITGKYYLFQFIDPK